MKYFINCFKPFKSLVIFATVALLVLSLSRLLLMMWLHQRVDLASIPALLWGGIRVDVSTVGYLLIPLFLVTVISWFSSPSVQIAFAKASRGYAILAIALLVLVEAATPAFINQYDIRPNRLFVEYLIYPKEVASMLLHGHLITVISTFILLGLTVYLGWKWLPKFTLNFGKTNKLATAASFFVMFFILAICARGTLGHRPLNPALVYFSQDSLVNSLVLNSSYSVAFALKNLDCEKSARDMYGKMDSQQVIQQVRDASGRDQFLSDVQPTLSINHAYNQGKKKNLVIVLEESLGARFVGKLGGSGITPELDKLYHEGWGFEHLYATGTRSVRGIEAVTTGFVPGPSRSVVKLSKSQKNFYTLAQTLSAQGYATQFVYGGESHFDNMKSFFLGNGFNQIVDQQNIKNPNFVASWGASDEDLFNQADIELTKLANAEQPFFSLIFTSSNHDPFDIPAGKVSLDEGFQTDNAPRDLAIKYADFALGKFFDKAKTSTYWQDTIFLVVADHDVRVYGSEPVPIKSFHIPAVILNSDFDGTNDARLVSQLDLPVTLLSLMGIQQPTPMLGFDLTKTYPVERAMMQYYDNFAYIENGQAVVLTPGEKVSYWAYNPLNKNQTLLLDEPESQLKQKALAHVLFSSIAYQQQWYQAVSQ